MKAPSTRLFLLGAAATVVAVSCGTEPNTRECREGMTCWSPPPESPVDAGDNLPDSGPQPALPDAAPVTDSGTVSDAGGATDAGVSTDAGSYRYEACSAVAQCLNSASCARRACGGACLTEASPDARANAEALLDCAERNNCASGDFACLGTNCSQEGLNCGLGVGGASSCAQTLGCVSGCGQDYGCMLRCGQTASPDARSKLQALMSCALTSGCGTDQACIAQRCSTQVVDCLTH